uniref:Cytochrome C oxidase mono-heme subunit/FixO n=1 Tax=Simulacricoccus ruber TaxID=2303410 RepID=A0A3Q8I1Y1_9BACT|nr:cytochrome C oxidase mono-heme subunit/FixO [Simulacricoccus ruber]
MNKILPITLLTLALLASATMLLVVVPAVQIRGRPPTPGLRDYTATELHGRTIYIREGCVYCHSQQTRSADQSPDVERGWGRASVAEDYMFDKPHLLGTMRSGPDLLNIGARLPSAQWHLTHLYQPRAIYPWSLMPSYRYLFQVKSRLEPGDVAVWVPEEQRPRGGTVVATRDAQDLVAYLLSLDRTYPAPVNGVRDDGFAEKGGTR